MRGHRVAQNHNSKYPKYLRAGLQLVPFGIGSSIASLWSEYKTKVANRRLEELINAIGSKLSSVKKESVNLDYIKCDEFQALLEEIVRSATTQAHEQKRRQLHGVLYKSVVDETPYDTGSLFVRLINQFSSLHIRLLKYFQDTSKDLSIYVGVVTNPFRPASWYGDIVKVIKERGPKNQYIGHTRLTGPSVEAELIKKAAADLLREQLVHDLLISSIRTIIQEPKPKWSEKQTEEVKKYFDSLDFIGFDASLALEIYLITSLGEAFLEHIGACHPINTTPWVGNNVEDDVDGKLMEN